MIKIQQALWGYSDGHHLIASSAPLSNESHKILGILTDLSGSETPSAFNGYLTGYPLKNENCYALSKTWYAPEMTRPGCVWTHTLFLGYDNISLNWNGRLFDLLFKRPNKDSRRFDDYSRPINIEDGLCAKFPLNKDPLSDTLFTQITKNKLPVIIACDNDVGSLNYAIEDLFGKFGVAFFKEFSFCTGSFSNRMVVKKQLDMQVVPESIARYVLRTGSEKSTYLHFPFDYEVNANLEDTNKLREFIDFCGPDFYRINYWYPLQKIYEIVLSSSFLSFKNIISYLQKYCVSQDAIDEAVLRIFKAIFLESTYRIQKDISSKVLLLGYLLFQESNSVRNLIGTDLLMQALNKIWIESHEKALELTIKITECQDAVLKKDVLMQSAQIMTPVDYSCLLGKESSVALEILQYNLNFGMVKDLWYQPKAIKTKALKVISTCVGNNTVDLRSEEILITIYENSNIDIIEDVYRAFGDKSISAFFNWSSLKKSLHIKQKYWVAICRYNPVLSVERLISAFDDVLIDWVIGTLDPYSKSVLEVPSKSWELLFHKLQKKYDRSLELTFAQFILPIILQSSDSFSYELIRFAFINVHNLLLHNQVGYEQWSKLATLLPVSDNSNDWDKCKRIRKAAKIRNLNIDFNEKNI